MDLLPKQTKDFSKPEYWDKFFKKRGGKAFEWYGEYPELCGVLHKYIRPSDSVLMVGCGNSQLGADLYDVGYRSIVNVDISDLVIRQMKDKNREQRPDMKFLQMDVTNMAFGEGEFSVALDKGTLDALMVDDTEATHATIDLMFSEIDRTLKLMGRYIIISLVQEHILKKAVNYFSDKGWAVRIHSIVTEAQDDSNKTFYTPLFALVFTKFKKNPSMPKILEACVQEEKTERYGSAEQLMDVVREMQGYAIIRQRVSKWKMSGEQISLQLFGSRDTPRYTLTIVDADRTVPHLKFAIFIVPRGKEGDWLYSTDEGRLQLLSSVGCERLLVVTMSRHETYGDLQAIQDELSARVLELAPPGFKQGTKVPFVSAGNDAADDNVTVVKQGTSPLSGDYIIQEVAGDDGIAYRKLIFLANENVVQSEARLKTVPTKKKGKGKRPSYTVDKSYLACQHHIAMVAGISCVQCDNFRTQLGERMSVLLIGLGGGGLPSFIHQYFPKISLDVVDIDPEVVTIATDWFEFRPDDRLRFHVADGLQFVQKQKQQGQCHDVIMLDVDSKDPSVGMSCPPLPFVQPEFLADIHACLNPGGVLVLNLVCRDKNLKLEVVGRVASIFQTVLIHDIKEEVNEVVYAVKQKPVCEENTKSDKSKEKDSISSCKTGAVGTGDNENRSEIVSGEDLTILTSKTKEHGVCNQKTEKGAKGENETKEPDFVKSFIEKCKMMNKQLRKQGCPKEDVDLSVQIENLKLV